MKHSEFVAALLTANPNQIPEKETILDAVSGLLKDLHVRDLPIGQFIVDPCVFGKLCVVTGEKPVKGAENRFIRVESNGYYVDINEQKETK